MPPIPIVIDTNVLVAGLRSNRGASHRLLSLIGSATIQPCLSVPLVLEYESVLLRERDEIGLSTKDIADFLDFLCQQSSLHMVYFLWRPHLHDPNDHMVLELAVASGCRHIITYNKRDFRGVEVFGIEILTARQFLQTIGQLP